MTIDAHDWVGRPLLRADALALSAASLGPLPFAISAGDVIQITGESGSGKSSLLRCLAHLDAQATGKLFFKGQPVQGNSTPLFRQQVIYVPQTPPRFSLSVLASLEQAFLFKGTSTKYDVAHLEALVEKLRLPSSILKRPLSQVSGGEAQRLGLVRALLLKPTVLLLDEPTSALDSRSAEALFLVLRDWFEGAARALVMVTHQNTHLDTTWPQRHLIDLPSGTRSRRS